MASQVVAGVALLGGGAMLRDGLTVRGSDPAATV